MIRGPHRSLSLLLPLALGAGMSSQPAAASTLVPLTLRDRVERAELIAEATVLQVRYRMSVVAAEDHVALPHTFVSFRIERLIHGSAAGGDEVTLRFLGGRDPQGRTLFVGGIPQFRVGDREILFVERNGERMCPVVGWEQGRFRVFDGDVFDEHGRELWFTPDQGIIAGPRRLDLDVVPVRLRDEGGSSVAGHGCDEAHDHGASRPFTPPAGALRPDANGFSDVLRRMACELTAAGRITARAPVASARADVPFSIRSRLADAPPAEPSPGPRPSREEREEREEQEKERRADR